MSDPLIIHPIFDKCRYYTLDAYWRDVLQNCARNHFPKGMRFDPSTQTVYIRKVNGKRGNSYQLPASDMEAFNMLIHIFRQELDLHSPSDVLATQMEIKNSLEVDQSELDCEWKKIKPRSMRDILLADYICRLRQEYGLNDRETRQLSSTVAIGFKLKQITAEHVHYHHRAIQNIKGLKFDFEKRRFCLTNFLPAGGKPEKEKRGDALQALAEQYVKSYQAQRRALT